MVASYHRFSRIQIWNRDPPGLMGKIFCLFVLIDNKHVTEYVSNAKLNNTFYCMHHIELLCLQCVIVDAEIHLKNGSIHSVYSKSLVRILMPLVQDKFAWEHLHHSHATMAPYLIWIGIISKRFVCQCIDFRETIFEEKILSTT